MDDRYIGDGVYARFDGFALVLDLRRQAPTIPITSITLEPEVWRELKKFMKDAGEEE